jgi:hypothetical protein
MIPCLSRTGGDPETYFALIKRLMVRIHQLNQDLVRSRGKTVYNDRLATRVSPMPGGAIDSHVDVADPRCTASAAGPNTGTTCRFSVRYWITTRPNDSGPARGGSMMILAGGSFVRGTTGGAPRNCRALCALAPGAAKSTDRTTRATSILFRLRNWRQSWLIWSVI